MSTLDLRKTKPCLRVSDRNNRTDKTQKMARGLDIRIQMAEKLYYLYSETKGAGQLLFSNMQKEGFPVTLSRYYLSSTFLLKSRL